MSYLPTTVAKPGEASPGVASTRVGARHGLPPALGPVFPLLLAITDDERAAAAIGVTLALARTRGAVPTVLRALGEDREAEVVVSPFVGAIAEASLSPEYRNECRDALQKQVAAVVGEVRWRFEVADRPPVDAVIEEARQSRPGLIVMGLRHRSALHRAVSRDMLRSVVRSTRLPVLAVSPELRGLPKRVLVAVDFGEASIRAASLARHLLTDDGEMYLVHVANDVPDEMSQRTRLFGQRGIQWIMDELSRVIEDLSPSPRMKITSIVLEGDVQLSIEGYAEQVGADLLAVGSDYHSPLDRLLSGSVSMGLAHTARWSTLIVPSHHDEQR